jgi:choline kinase
LVVLAAGKPYKGHKPSALTAAGSRSNVLDWVLEAFEEEKPSLHLVLGYHAEDIAERYPGVDRTFNEKWEETYSAASALLAPVGESPVSYLCYSDILFRRSTVSRMAASSAPIVVAVDSRWRDRYDGRTQADIERCEKVIVASGAVTRLGADIAPSLANAEFIGLARFSGVAVRMVADLPAAVREDLKCANVSALIEYLRVQGLAVEAVDVAGDWAELNAAEDLAHFILGTKAQTLARLRGLVKKSRIEDVHLFTLREWREAPDVLVKRVHEQFNGIPVVVRSSALTEDSFASANAGAYDSVLNVDSRDKTSLMAAIETVIDSYPDGNPEHQVLVQPMVQDVVSSGVVFTRSLSNGSPYRVFNYEESSSTDGITSGSSRNHKTLVLHRDITEPPEEAGDDMRALVIAVQEIEGLLNIDSLDIEFAISKGGTVHILQVRPIAVYHSGRDVSDEDIRRLLDTAQCKFRAWQRPTPFVLGKRAVFGVMPDWNPAEIISTKPGRLAMSLYRKLIMDDAWSTQRAEYGYRDVRPEPLLVAFAGHPYVNVRASFNSFVPASLSNPLAERLVDFYLDWLVAHPHLHDKVEFDVVPTCFGLDFARWEKRLADRGGFTASEISQLRSALLHLTTAAFTRNDGDLARIEMLVARHTKVMAADLPPLDRATMLLADCRRFGTVAFSHLARSAFVAVTLLKSAVATGVLTEAEKDAFLNSVRTVTHRFMDDAHAVARNRMPWDDFVAKYGHLRPGTYDITSPCYADDPEKYLRPIVHHAQDTHDTCAHLWTPKAWGRLCAAMAKAGLPSDAVQVERFLRTAIEGREYAKFVFTRNLSAALNCLVEFGAEQGLDRQALANLDIDDLLSLYTGTVTVSDVPTWLQSRADENARLRRIAAAVELPPLLVRDTEFYGFLYPNNQPNYVGSGAVIADAVDLAEHGGDGLELSGKIVLIPQADPGYDWLFSQNIAGLITMYGGANSHMAIRAAEFGLPAAIGVGETLYSRISGAHVIALDCGNRRIEVVQ